MASVQQHLQQLPGWVQSLDGKHSALAYSPGHLGLVPQLEQLLEQVRQQEPTVQQALVHLYHGCTIGPLEPGWQ